MKDLASHIMDIVQNSIRARASRIEIEVMEDHGKDCFTIEIRDNGTGMDEATLAQVCNPFFTSRTVRKVGLGIPLLQQNAEQTGGKISLVSALGKGTTVNATFVHSHLDRPPLGNMAETISLLLVANPDIHFIYKHTTNTSAYLLDTEELKQILEGVPLTHPEILQGIQNLIREKLKEIKADQ